MDPQLAALLAQAGNGAPENHGQHAALTQAGAPNPQPTQNQQPADQTGQPDVLGEMMREQGMAGPGGMPDAGQRDPMADLMGGGGPMPGMGMGMGGMGMDPRLMAMQAMQRGHDPRVPMVGMMGMGGMGARAYERAIEAYKDAMEDYEDAMEDYQDAIEDAMHAAMWSGRRW